VLPVTGDVTMTRAQAAQDLTALEQDIAEVLGL
jgi:hypothetical protein